MEALAPRGQSPTYQAALVGGNIALALAKDLDVQVLHRVNGGVYWAVFGNALDSSDALGAIGLRQQDLCLQVDQTRGIRSLLEQHLDRHPLGIDAILLTVLRDECPDAASQRGYKQLWWLRATIATAHHIRHIDYHRMIADL